MFSNLSSHYSVLRVHQVSSELLAAITYAGIDKGTYFHAYQFYSDAGEEGVAYSKTIECMPYINSLPLTASQKTALAQCWWAASTVNKYKLW